MQAFAALTIVAIAATCSAAHAQTIFKCRDAKGQMSYQHQPCDGTRRGAVEVQPANVVDGRPIGDKQSRIDAERSRRVRLGLERGEVVEGMTKDEVRQALERNRGPGLQPCYSDLEIRNAEVGAQSFKATPREARQKQREIERMKRCLK